MIREEFNNALRTAVSGEFEQITNDIPEGFSLTTSLKSRVLILYRYSNTTEKSITFSQSATKNTTIFMDNRITTAKPLNIVGIEATLYTLKDITYVLWIQGTYIMHITCLGSFEESEIIKMVKSVRAVEADTTVSTATTSDEYAQTATLRLVYVE